MGGKKKDTQRTKGNTKPSSSSRSAKLLENNVPFIHLPDSTSTAFLEMSSESQIPFEFKMTMKKMMKHDETTKYKAISQFRQLCEDSTEIEEIKFILPYWPRIYSKISNDIDTRVREEAQQALLTIVKKVGRSLAPFLKALLPIWLSCTKDPYGSVRQMACDAFDAAFHSKRKFIEALVFCEVEIMNYIEDIITKQRYVSFSDSLTVTKEDSESKFVRSVSCALLVYQEMLNCKVISEKTKSQGMSILNSPKFWKYSTTKSPLILSSWYQLILGFEYQSSICNDSVFKKFCSVVFINLDESESFLLQHIWNAALHLTHFYPNWFTAIDLKTSLKKIINLIKNGCPENVMPQILTLFDQISQHSSSTFGVEVLKALHDYSPLYDKEASLYIDTYFEIALYSFLRNSESVLEYVFQNLKDHLIHFESFRDKIFLNGYTNFHCSLETKGFDPWSNGLYSLCIEAFSQTVSFPGLSNLLVSLGQKSLTSTLLSIVYHISKSIFSESFSCENKELIMALLSNFGNSKNYFEALEIPTVKCSFSFILYYLDKRESWDLIAIAFNFVDQSQGLKILEDISKLSSEFFYIILLNLCEHVIDSHWMNNPSIFKAITHYYSLTYESSYTVKTRVFKNICHKMGNKIEREKWNSFFLKFYQLEWASLDTSYVVFLCDLLDILSDSEVLPVEFSNGQSLLLQLLSHFVEEKRVHETLLHICTSVKNKNPSILSNFALSLFVEISKAIGASSSPNSIDPLSNLTLKLWTTLSTNLEVNNVVLSLFPPFSEFKIDKNVFLQSSLDIFFVNLDSFSEKNAEQDNKMIWLSFFIQISHGFSGLELSSESCDRIASLLLLHVTFFQGSENEMQSFISQLPLVSKETLGCQLLNKSLEKNNVLWSLTLKNFLEWTLILPDFCTESLIEQKSITTLQALLPFMEKSHIAKIIHSELKKCVFLDEKEAVENLVVLSSCIYHYSADIGIENIRFLFQAIKNYHSSNCENFLFCKSLKGKALKDILISVTLAQLFTSILKSHTLLKEHWDTVLCYTCSWIQTIEKSKEELASNPHLFKFVYVLSDLVSSIAMSVDLAESERQEEWMEFFAGEIYGTLFCIFTSYLCHQEEHVSHVTKALTYIPDKQILYHRLPPKFFAHDEENEFSVNIQVLMNHLVPLLSQSTITAVKIISVQLLLRIMESIAKANECTKETILDVQKLPSRFLDSLESNTPLVKNVFQNLHFGDSVTFTKTYDNTFSSYSLLNTYLLNWKLIIQFIAASSQDFAPSYNEFMRTKNLLDDLIPILFHVMVVEQSPPPFEKIKNDFESIRHLAISIYYDLLQHQPALFRSWWTHTSKRISGIIEKYTSAYFTSLLWSEEVKNIQCSKTVFDNMTITVRAVSREVMAVYTIDQGCVELNISLPTNFPLGQVVVNIQRKVGVSNSQWRVWLFQLTTFLTNQNGSLLEGLLIWKKNLDKRFEGLDECYICFSILHGANHSLPKLGCRTCKKKFHSDCLYKWFSTSNKSTCPLCRNLF